MESRVELFARIRRDARVEGLSIRELARRHGVGRPTVRQALAQADPPARKPRVRTAPRLDMFKPAIDGMLRQDLDEPRKQRHTARRVFARLAEEHGATELSYSTVRDYVRRRRPEIDTEAGRLPETFVPQEHAPAAEAEVDFGEVWVVLAGVKTKCHMFAFRLSHSGKAIHRVYPTQAQEAFLEGHIDAFEDIGGIPTRHIRYDNLTDAVVKVVYGTGRQRTENQRWLLFRSHYGFDAFYCHPGIEGAHEKGGIEGDIGRFRRTHLSPMPVVDSLAQLNEKVRRWDLDDENRRIGDRIRTVAQDFALERELLAPITAERFEPGLALTPRVSRSSLIRVRMASYSVPARFIGRPVRVSLRASEVIVFDGRTEIARHPRVIAMHGQSVNLDHYLEVLLRKPGALPGSTALAHARAAGVFTAAHEAFWAAARKTDGDAGGTRALIDVLLLHRSIPAEDIVAGIAAALTVGAVTADVVAVEARRHGTQGGHSVDGFLRDQARGPERRVISLTQRRLADPAAVIAGLPADTRPLPSVAAYDQLLQLPERGTTTAAPAAKEGTVTGS
jgi:transposase